MPTTKTKPIRVRNLNGALFTVTGVACVDSADGGVWCVRLRDSDRFITDVPMATFAKHFTAVET